MSRKETKVEQESQKTTFKQGHIQKSTWSAKSMFRFGCRHLKQRLRPTPYTRANKAVTMPMAAIAEVAIAAESSAAASEILPPRMR